MGPKALRGKLKQLLLLLLALVLIPSPPAVTGNYLESGIVVFGIGEDLLNQLITYQLASGPAQVLQWFAG